MAALLLAVSLTGCGSSSPSAQTAPMQPAFGPFAGYNWLGSVQSVSAQILVPKIRSDSPSGVAATWIGSNAKTAAKSAAGLTPPFIQVGVQTERTTSPGRAPHDLYFAFWSDTSVAFRPKFLFAVHPGDKVFLSLIHAHDRWVVLADDPARSSRKLFTTSQEGAASFVAATFTQEDPTNVKSGSQLRYPKLSDIRFSRMRVNGHAPSVSKLSSTWLSSGARVQGPSKVEGNSFTVVRVHPSAAALYYQDGIDADQEAAVAFNIALLSWSKHTNPQVVRSTSVRFARLLAPRARRLAAYHWPPRVAPLMARALRLSRVEHRKLLTLADNYPARLAPFKAWLRRLTPAAQTLSLKLRARLHLPAQNGLSGGSVTHYVHTHAP